MERNTAIMVVLGILIVMSLMQTYQLTSLKAKVSESGMTTRSSATSVPTAQQGGIGSSSAESLGELNSMVGGC